MIMPSSANFYPSADPVLSAADSKFTSLAPEVRRTWLGFFGVGLAVVAIVVAAVWFAQRVSTQINFVRNESVPAALTAQLAFDSFKQQRAAYQEVLSLTETQNQLMAVANAGL